MTGTAVEAAKNGGITDEEVVSRVLAGEKALFEILMRRHNQRLYRTSRAILRDDAQAEDVVQDTYVRAYQHLGQFAGRAKFAAWLIRIAVNEGLARLRGRQHYEEPFPMEEDEGDQMDRFLSPGPNPEQQASSSELRRLLEESIEALPDSHRTVFVLREVEEMSTTETAEALGITEENVKVRLHRARAILREKLYSQASIQSKDAFTFGAQRCDHVVKNVLERIYEQGKEEQKPETMIH